MKEIDIGPMGSMVLWIFVPVRRYLEQPSSLFCCLCIQEITKQVQYSPNEVGNHEMSGSFSPIVCLVTDYTLIQCCKIQKNSFKGHEKNVKTGNIVSTPFYIILWTSQIRFWDSIIISCSSFNLQYKVNFKYEYMAGNMIKTVLVKQKGHVKS